MSYTLPSDFTLHLDEHELEAVRRDYEKDGKDKLKIGIEYAETYVKDRLSERFDMDTEYAKTGDDRNEILLEIIICITIWKVTQVFPTVQLDEKRHACYMDAKQMIKEAQKGELLKDVPTNETPSTSGLPQYGVSDENELLY